jgi:hypothetical protein
VLPERRVRALDAEDGVCQTAPDGHAGALG